MLRIRRPYMRSLFSWRYYTPRSDVHGPRFKPGSGGGARIGAYMHVQRGVISYSSRCLSVCLSVALHTRARQYLLSLDTDLTRNTRAPHFTPQHWLLCHMGLY